MKHAFHLDEGAVETMAHYEAARHFNPNVDYILDIGGQDIKCFKIKDGRIDDIVLNEACSSGCGSFLETFAKSLGYSAQEFAQLGLKAQPPGQPGHALHGVHELRRQAGAEKRRERSRTFRQAFAAAS